MTFKPNSTNYGRSPQIRCPKCHQNGKCKCPTADKGPSSPVMPIGRPTGPTGPA